MQKMIENNEFIYSVVIPEHADEYEVFAKEEFMWILSLAGVTKPRVFTETEFHGDKAVFIGKTQKLYETGRNVSYDELGYDGFRIETVGTNIFIYGLQRGTYFGVYEFFRHYLNYRYYAMNEVHVDHVSDCEIQDLNITVKPDIEARSLGFRQTFALDKDPEYVYHTNRLRLGRNLYSDWILSAHTYFQIMPKDKYYEQHPDWYSPDGKNLCLSSEEMTKEFIENVKKIVKSKKGNYIMLGQEDTDNFCDCPKCKERIEKWNTPSALVMQFTNKVAREVKAWLQEEEPGRVLQFVAFAYNATSFPPVVKDENDMYQPIDESVVADENVAVMVVPFRFNLTYDYMHDTNHVTRESFRGWSAVSKNIHTWSYCTNFDNYMIPLNNYKTIKKNYQLLRDWNVRFVFDQGSHNSMSPVMEEYRMFLQANLLWNTEADEKELQKDFFENYYKDVAPQMEEYHMAMRNRWEFIEKKYKDLCRTGAADSSDWMFEQYWPREFVNYLCKIFEDARCVLENIRVERWDDYLQLKQRIGKEFMSVRFIMIHLYGSDYGSDLPQKIENFKADCKKYGITSYAEGRQLQLRK